MKQLLEALSSFKENPFPRQATSPHMGRLRVSWWEGGSRGQAPISVISGGFLEEIGA
jgi:hypothetical protein